MKANAIAALAALLGGFVLYAFGYLIVDGRKVAERQANTLAAVLSKLDGHADRLIELHADISQLTERSTELRSDIDKLTDLMRIESPADGGHRRLDIRLFAIRSQLAQADQPVIVIGDSIAEGALLPSSICGHAVVNAGVGGLSAAGYLPFAKKFLTNEAGLIVVALGTNDSTIVSPESLVGYSDLLDLLTQHTPKVILAGIPPFDMTGALAKAFFNQALGDRNDAAIRQIAVARNLPFVDLRKGIRGDHLTNDGIHLNADGYRQWLDAMLAQIRLSLGCLERSAGSVHSVVH